MTRDLNKYERDYTASPFEEAMAGIRRQKVFEFLAKHQFRNIVEVGCGENSLFETLDDFQSFTVIEPCPAFFVKAQAAARAHKAAARIQLFDQTFQEFAAEVPMDCIIISSLLH